MNRAPAKPNLRSKTPQNPSYYTSLDRHLVKTGDGPQEAVEAANARRQQHNAGQRLNSKIRDGVRAITYGDPTKPGGASLWRRGKEILEEILLQGEGTERQMNRVKDALTIHGSELRTARIPPPSLLVSGNSTAKRARRQNGYSQIFRTAVRNSPGSWTDSG